MFTDRIEPPVVRSRWRRSLGRRVFVAQRMLRDRASVELFARPGDVLSKPIVVFEHASLIRRELAGVDMRLQDNKAVNLELAAMALDRTVLYPGEVLSFWRLVGRPSARRGFLSGLVLDNGEVTEDVGGGLCQFSNLLFWIVAHSPLTVVERHRHTYDVFPDVGRVVPFGAGATVAYNYVDFRVRNDTESTFQLHVDVDATHLRGRLIADRLDPHAFKVVERGHRFVHQPWGGYTRHNEIVRQSLIDGVVVSEEVLCINDAVVRYTPTLGPGASASECSG